MENYGASLFFPSAYRTTNVSHANKTQSEYSDASVNQDVFISDFLEEIIRSLVVLLCILCFLAPSTRCLAVGRRVPVNV